MSEETGPPRSPWAEKLIHIIEESDEVMARVKHLVEEIQKLKRQNEEKP